MTCPKCWIPSITDYIGYYKDCMSEDICDEIIKHVEVQRSSDLNQSTYSSHKGLSEDKQRVLMDEIWFRNGEKFYDSFKLAFNNSKVPKTFVSIKDLGVSIDLST